MITLEQYVEDLRYFSKLSAQDSEQATGFVSFTHIVNVDPEVFHKQIEEHRKTHDIRQGCFVQLKGQPHSDIALCMRVYESSKTMDIMLDSGECHENVRMILYKPTGFTADLAFGNLLATFKKTQEVINDN